MTIKQIEDLHAQFELETLVDWKLLQDREILVQSPAVSRAWQQGGIAESERPRSGKSVKVQVAITRRIPRVDTCTTRACTDGDTCVPNRPDTTIPSRQTLEGSDSYGCSADVPIGARHLPARNDLF